MATGIGGLGPVLPGAAPAVPSQASGSATVSGQAVTEQDFLTLLAAELQYQDPTQPVQGTQFVAQLAQFATLGAMTTMQQTLSTLAAGMGGGNPLLAAAPLLGRTVAVASGAGSASGQVTGLELVGGQLNLTVSGIGSVPLSQVVSVSES
jgi:flagellar basal-body rod modification protein FlgD